MKKLLTSVAMALLLVGCAKEYDDSGLKERVSALETRVTALESNVQALQSAIGEGVFVAKVQEYADPDTGKTIGVTITYTNGDVKYFQISPKDDVDAPVLGVIQSGSGALVWAIDGVAILVDGDEVPVYQTPVFTIDDDGNLWVEVDGKKTKLGQVQNEGATLVDGIFTNIKVEQDKVVLTLSDETKVNIPFAEAFKIELMLDECVYTEAEPIPVHYAITAATAGTVVRVAGYNPFDFSVVVNNEEKIIEITPLTPGAAAQLLIVADSGIGLVSTATLLVEPEGLKVVDIPFSETVDYMAEGEGGSVTAHIVSNIEPEVKPVDEWIHLVDVKATAYTVTLSLDDNTTGEVRTGMVNILKKGTDEVLQTIIIGQLAAEIEEGPANLSKKESANSYLVYAPGEYKFKAVKGNSEESVGEVAKAEILWETYNNDQEVTPGSVIANVAYADGFITFATPEILLPGNAVIAAKDANDVILWSWHIWVPATEIVNNTYGISTPAMMDRYLGALEAGTVGAPSTAANIGLAYEWGRKDPFPGPAAFNSGTGAAIAGAAISAATAAISIEESVQKPTTMVVIDGADWNSTPDATLWDNEGKKTLYDPCPPGYKVPAVADCPNLYVSDLSTIPGWSSDGSINYYFTIGDPVTVFPLCGYVDEANGKYGYAHVYDRVSIWSADAASDSKGKNIDVRAGSRQQLNSTAKSRASFIRCVVVNEGAIVPPTPTEGGGEPGGIPDLSKEGSANCYIIPATTDAGAQYKFKAVKGNSAESVGTVASAEVFWETWNTADEPTVGSVVAAAEYADGYVTITMPAETIHAGNAVVAVKDADGNILWSWHIWVPATEVAADPAGAAMLGGTILDRNLGALIAPVAGEEALTVEALGLYYQWGRKDPFPGPQDFVDYPSKAKLAGAQFTKDANQRTVEYGIAHPNEYSYGAGSCDWLAEPIADLWDKEGSKTIYDPCPVGYKVPAYDAELPMWKKTNDNWTFSDNFWMTNSASTSVFPLAGYIDDGNGSFVMKKRTFYWSSKEYTDHIRACGADVRAPSYNGEKTYKARGASVRCVAE